MDRMEKLNDHILEKLAYVLSQKTEVPFDFFITVVKVSCSASLKEATVFLSVLPFDKSEQALAWIIRNKGHIQKELGKEIKNLRNTPKLYFRTDDTQNRVDEVYTIIDEIAEK